MKQLRIEGVLATAPSINEMLAPSSYESDLAGQIEYMRNYRERKARGETIGQRALALFRHRQSEELPPAAPEAF